MSFFNFEAAYTLQFFTFPLEAIGFSLAMIELRYPLVAAKVASYIRAQYEEMNSEQDATIGKTTLAAFIGSWILLLAIAFLNEETLVLLAPALSAVLLTAIMLGSVWFAVRFVEGREVGNVGLVLAGLGLLGESCQYLVQTLY